MSKESSLLELIDTVLANDEVILPVFDHTALRVQQEVSKEEPNINDIEKLINCDPALTTKVLSVANSAFYKGLEGANTIRRAILRMGVNEVANLVILVSQRRNFHSDDPALAKIMEQLWQHSVGCATGAHWLAKQCGFLSTLHEAFTAALLHDIGKLFLLTAIGEVKKQQGPSIKIPDALISEVLDNFHCSYGYNLMLQWNLPQIYAEVARDHHIDNFDHKNFLLIMVRLADKACHKLGIGFHRNPDIVLKGAPEAGLLNISEINLAKLEILLEDSLGLSC
ncbi:MAG: HDOD domain-containing protein [Desulfobulbaceae bacterium]|nr:HDOD domain-containing protein [Desulfobulbaceae bacterium]HIJ79521.1 HDOD domain-containing protein [Deltaproteobacteria bacterium]